ncbi:hypothetical protein KP509_35G014300 [Ceratopteris richardii]|uniref:Mediator of RNA polymerase II transcription subunit 19a n=2 Tax=Ceratopteris richardii TaxID=49495 RepID=A0A8T2QDD1_CERRI|nr:hypothetical protein KP509_35G014300 [Ceratopteris richardii]
MDATDNRTDDANGPFRLITSAPRSRELTGAVDLLGHYGLRDLHEKFCQRPLPASVGESYLRNVVGDTEIRKGEGMELGQLLGPDMEAISVHIHPIEMDILQKSFTLKESGSISLPEVDRGIPTISGRVKDESKDRDRKHKKHKKHKDRHKDKEKDRDKDKHKDRDKDKDKDKEKSRDKDKSKKRENGEEKKHHKKKRKHDGDEEEGEGHKHKKKKHKHSSKGDVQEKIVTR